MSNNWDQPSGWTHDTQSEAEYEYKKKDCAGNWAYDYTVERGRRLDGEKAIRQWRRASVDDIIIASANGEPVDKKNFRILNIGNHRPHLFLYRSEEIERADRSEIVCIGEGEKDVDELIKRGLCATTNPGGALKWKDCFSTQLVGRKVVLFPDNDVVGRKHMAAVYRSLKALGIDTAVVELWKHWPDMPEAGDVSDWFDSGRSAVDLQALIEAAGVPGWLSELGRPVIEVIGGQLDRIATEAEQSLIKANTPFYSFGPDVVKPVVDEVEAAKGRTTKVARLTSVSAEMMRDYMCRAARYVKRDKKGNVFDVNPPRDIALTVLSRDGEWTFPRIVGVITTPTLRPDGSVLHEPGYDPATRLVLAEPPPLPHLSEKPSREEAEQALRLLDGLLTEFPFAGEASRSVALSALMTPICIGAIGVAPMHLANAPTPGTGKSYLFDIVSAIALGRICPVISAGASMEETEKRLGAALMKGQTLISIDNLNGDLEGAAVCQIIERPVVELRVLGQSKNVTIETRRTILANGNNIRVVDDVARRSIIASLDANKERPELRQFNGRPVDEVLANRGDYIAAVLTIVRAYMAAGSPNRAPDLASFEAWSRLVRSSLIWLGKVDPVATMEDARANDPKLDVLRRVVTTWRAVDAGKAKWASKDLKYQAEIMDDGYQDPKRIYPEFFEALYEVAGQGRGVIDTHKLGKWLAGNVGRIVEGLKICRQVDRHTKQPLWFLEEVSN